MFDSQEANIAYFEMLRSCDHLLLSALLSHMQRLCFSMSEESEYLRGEYIFATSHLDRIIDLKLGREIPLLEEGLKLAYVLIAVAERVSATLCTLSCCVFPMVEIGCDLPLTTEL